MFKKILFITHQLTRTGAPQVLLDMVRCCVEEGHAVAAISLSDGDARADWEKLRIDVTVFPQLALAREQIVPIMQRFDVIIVNTLVCVDVIPMCVEAGTKTFWWIHEHENYFEYYRDKLPQEGQLGRNVRVLGVSPITQRLLKKRAGYKRAGLLPFSVPDAYDGNKKGEKRRDGKVRFMCIGVYAFVKGQDILCAAIESLPEEVRQGMQFCFYGDRREVDPAVYGPVAGAAEAYEEVEICDSVPHEEILCRLAEADYLIIPSRKEPMSAVAVEAMMLHIPCIISDICGVAGYLTDGKDALLFKAGNVEDLLDKICRAYNMNEEDYRQMGEEARKQYEREFSESVFREHVDELLR